MKPPHIRAFGFTLIELVIVVIILSTLSAIALPRVVDMRQRSRVAVIEGVTGTMRSTIHTIRMKARVTGLSPVASNPSSSSDQTSFVIETELGTSEVDWRNLCPESQAEVGDALSMGDYISLPSSSGDLIVAIDNQYTRVGYDLDPGGCFVSYDSFACSVTTDLTGC